MRFQGSDYSVKWDRCHCEKIKYVEIINILEGKTMHGNTARPLVVNEQNEQIQEKTVRPFGIRDKFGYLFGDFGNDFFFTLVSSFLMVFYTDVFRILVQLL